jgi:hypothetical protein
MTPEQRQAWSIESTKQRNRESAARSYARKKLLRGPNKKRGPKPKSHPENEEHMSEDEKIAWRKEHTRKANLKSAHKSNEKKKQLKLQLKLQSMVKI